jgi:hypothetical protein
MAVTPMNAKGEAVTSPRPREPAAGVAVDAERRSRLIDLGEPATRPLKAFAFDLSQGTLLGNQMQLSVRYEQLDPGPVVRDMFAWDGIAIIDYDASNGVYYKPVDLEDPKILVRGGLDPIEADPRFHQQMVYAVVTETIQHFEAALGRRIHWRRATRRDKERLTPQDDIYTLNIFPHAMVSANAFYSRKAHGILFGYFRASVTDPGRNLPGQIVYTCLSHDIIVHETTHAIIDGIRAHFTEQTNPDVAAFHEAFADLAALFRHFSHKDTLLDKIQQTGGLLFEERSLATDAAGRVGEPVATTAQTGRRNPLVELAQQFGEATGRGKGLRSALDTAPNVMDIEKVFESHARGAILVSAVFDAYFTTYLRRTADLFRIYRAGGGAVGTDLPDPLARLLAEEASRTAEQFFTLCVRALDYCPPVDITFGDFLRAVITSHFDLHPTDKSGLRDAFMQAFRVRGIIPDGASFFSDTAIAWPMAQHLPPIPNLEFGDPNGLTRDEQDRAAEALRSYFKDPNVRGQFAALGALDPEAPVNISSFHPVFRIGEDGALRTEMVVEVMQEQQVDFNESEPGLGTFPMRGGATIIIGKPTLVEARRERYETGRYTSHGNIRYVISKQLEGDSGTRRKARQRAHYQRLGLVEGNDPDRFMIDFALTHQGY